LLLSYLGNKSCSCHHRPILPVLPLDFIPPAYSAWVLRLVHGILPLLLRVRVRRWLPSGIAKIEATGAEILARLYHQFQEGQIRLVLAFRHVEVDDPLVGLYVLSRLVPEAARRQGIRLREPLHAHFLYDRGMPLWGGEWLGWLLSRLGGIPIRRGRRVDRVALKAARQLLLDGAISLCNRPRRSHQRPQRTDQSPGTGNGSAVLLVRRGPGQSWSLRDRHFAAHWHSVLLHGSLLDEAGAPAGAP
jgi:hypothetical protein